MDATSPPGTPDPDRDQVELVVELLDIVYLANGRMAAELDRLSASRASVSEASIEQFLRLAEDLRPGAAARLQLGRLDNDTQIAGAAAWIARRQLHDPAGELLPTHHDPRDPGAQPAAARVTTRWRGNGSDR
jgi:hypothetical protein